MDKKDFNHRLSEISNAFSAARNKIKAQESNFKITPRELKDPMSKFNAGKPITGAELQKISENWQSKAPLIDEEGNAFVLKTNIESNIFLGKQVDDKNAQSVLYACKTCKKKMIEVEGYDLYFDVENMDMLKFFAKYGKQNLNNHSMLDVHHIDGIRSNVSKTNLKVLCKECHSEQPFHGHYKNALRARQGTVKRSFSDKPVSTSTSVSSSQRNKLASFIANPDRYATGSDKAKQKVLEVIETFEAIKEELPKSEQQAFLDAIRIYKGAITDKV